MYISQCIIAKNEENNIEYCLSHLKSVVDEQIVVDTGSTDRTVEIAEKLGAKVFHFEWVDDFSAARNFALDKAKGDWVIFLDCDEYFADSSIPLIKKNIKEIDRKKNINAIQSQLINIDKEKNVISVAKNTSPRIFKNKKNLRYRNRIHEHLVDFSIEKSGSAVVFANATEDLKILHTGYDKGVFVEKNKSARNFFMLKRELDQNPEDTLLNFYMSKSLYTIRVFSESLKYSQQALKYANETKDSKLYPVIYSQILYTMNAMQVQYDEIREMFEEAVFKYPKYPDYYRVMGLVEMRCGRVQEATEMLEKCILYCQNFKNEIESVALGQIENVYSDLLKAFIIADNRPKIVETSVALLNAEKYNYENLFVLIKTLLTSEDEERIIGFLTRIYDYTKFKDKIYLLKISQQCENKKMTEYFMSILSEEEKQAIE